MNETVYSIWAILEKSLLAGTLLSIFWFIKVVPKDLRRARNSGILAFFLICIICSGLLYLDYQRIQNEIQTLHTLLNQNASDLRVVHGKQTALKSLLLALNSDFEQIETEKSFLYDIMLDAMQEKSKISEAYALLTHKIDTLDTRLNTFQSALDSISFHYFGREIITDSLDIIYNRIISRLGTYGHLNFYKPSVYTREIKSIRRLLSLQAKSFLAEQQMIQKESSRLKNTVVSLRKELVGNIKIVFIGSDRKIVR